MRQIGVLAALLADTAARRRATRTMVQLCREHGYWGIQFDIENINVQDKHLFKAWYRETAEALRVARSRSPSSIDPGNSRDPPAITGFSTRAGARQLRGFSAWVLGPEDERIWEVLRGEGGRR